MQKPTVFMNLATCGGNSDVPVQTDILNMIKKYYLGTVLEWSKNDQQIQIPGQDGHEKPTYILNNYKTNTKSIVNVY